MADMVSEEVRSWMMSRVKGKDTAPELTVRSTLHQMGYRFRLHRKDLPGKPDIVLPRHRKAIFVNGCFWHQHPGCIHERRPKSNREYWDAKLSATVARDQRNLHMLEESGWLVLVIWECELKMNDFLVNRLQKFMS